MVSLLLTKSIGFIYAWQNVYPVLVFRSVVTSLMTIDLKIENLDRVSIPAKSVATFDIRHPIHGTTYGVRPRSAFEAVSVHFSLCWAI